MNIIYIVCHDLGRHLGCYGRKVKSPNIDAFAAKSVRFDHAFCNTAVCSPSRGACMTGMYAHNNGLMGLAHFGWHVFPHVRTIVDYFNEAGVETVHCGLSHEGEEGRSRYQTDFEVSFDSQLAENAVDDAIAWLRSRKKQGRTTPFYMNLGTREAHPVVWEKDTDPDGLPSRLYRVYGGPAPDDEIEIIPPSPDIPLLRETYRRFESAIRHLDREMGRFFRELERLEVHRDTMVIFTTDHGMNDWRGKGTPYERGLEIALLVRPPEGTGRPGVRHEMIQNIDLTPTLLDAMGVPRPSCLQGRSFLPLLIGGSYEPHRRIFYEWNFGGPQDDYSPVRAVRTEKFKLIRNFGPHNYGLMRPDEMPPDYTKAMRDRHRHKSYGMSFEHATRMLPEYELYDLEADPFELCNLADDPGHAAVKAELVEVLDRWMVETDDHILRGEVPQVPGPTEWDPFSAH